MGCLVPEFRDAQPNIFRQVNCAKYRWYGRKIGQYAHMVDNNRQWIYKICVRSDNWIVAGIKFYYKTPPKNEKTSGFNLTQGPWYGARSYGFQRCFRLVDYFNHVHIKSSNYAIHALSFSVKAKIHVSESFIQGGDVEETFFGGQLKSVEVYHSQGPTGLYGLKFNWLDC